MAYKKRKDNKHMIFESHAHYDDDAFDVDRDSLLKTMKDNGIGEILNVSAAVSGLDATMELMEQYPFVYGAFGIHPDEVGNLSEELIKKIELLCEHKKALAVGEIGLDYYWNKENHDIQRYWFERQMQIARNKKKPIIVHSRDAAADTLNVMKGTSAHDIGGVIHCFSYGKEMAREYLNMGFYLGIGGVVTFSNAKKLKEVVTYTPLQQLLLETDSPYLSPVPNRGKRNSSLNLTYIADEIARLKGCSKEEVIEVTQLNAKKLFGLI